jgi:bacillithiol biosynthesis deacetylase BshB1
VSGGKLDILGVGAHPDDVELGCGGALALAARQGKRVGIVHLTRGELGTRGTPDDRRREAERAAETLGAREMVILDCGDGALRTGEEEENALIEVLRRLRPELVLGPPPGDRHPDHGRAHRLVEAACFYAGLRNRHPRDPEAPRLDPHRPAATFHYMQHDGFEPDFVVDVTSVWEVRQQAVATYHSQVFQGTPEGPEALITKTASEDFWHALEGRARHFGNLIGATFGEPYGSRLPVAVKDLFDLKPGGVR